HGFSELRPHRVLEDVACLADGLGAAGFDERPLDWRVDVLEEADDVVALDDRPRGGRAAAVVVAVQPRYRIRDRRRLASPLRNLNRHGRPAYSAPMRGVSPGGGRSGEATQRALAPAKSSRYCSRTDIL